MTKSAAIFYVQNIEKNKYLNKYKAGKNYYDSKIEDGYLKHIFNLLNRNKNLDILEIGYFVGRVNKKLQNYFVNITVTDISKKLISNYKGNKFCLDWSKTQKIQNGKRYNFVCNIGHQLSFSCDIKRGLIYMSKLLKPDGIVFFDIWNSNCPKNFIPKQYTVQTMSVKKIESLLSKINLKILLIKFGFSFPYKFPRLFYIFCKFLGKNLGTKICWELDSKILTFFISPSKAQNIYVIAKKNK